MYFTQSTPMQLFFVTEENYNAARSTVRLALTVLVMLFYTCACYAQSKWGVRLDVGLENSDTRLFNTPDPRVFAGQPDFLNAQLFYLGVNRELSVSNRISILPSLGIKMTRQSFTRPFDHSLVRPSDNTRILRYYHKSESLGISPSVQLEYHFVEKFSFFIRSELFIPFRRAFKLDEGQAPYPFVSNELRVESFEVSPGLKIRYSKIHFGLSARALRVASLDEIIFGPWIGDEEFRSKHSDLHNPLRIVFTTDYWF
ncbi:hypothetical protein GGR27_001140 [Lewinella antarctica]|uniref:Outer membrane protein beta-barrel domain-containing protein n=1 Tax=Neolewinella antarctica TaxID=442734 RepID=A0ABX0X9G3_9BACT|nr:hypothetical protein [Neolewinella antarctica]